MPLTDREIERRLSSLERRVGKLPSRVHPGGGGGSSHIYRAATYAALPSGVQDGSLGYVTGKDNMYAMRNGTWRIIHAFVDTDEPTDIGECHGDLWVDTGSPSYILHNYNGVSWDRLSHFDAEPE